MSGLPFVTEPKFVGKGGEENFQLFFLSETSWFILIFHPERERHSA